MSDDLSITDSQDIAELLDSDKLPGGPDDPDLEPIYPLDRPLGIDQYGLTAAEEEVEEPFDERVLRDEPDPLAVELDGATPSQQAATGLPEELDSLEASLDPETRELVDRIEPELADARARADEDRPGEPVGRLVEPDDEDVSWRDSEGTSVARQGEQDPRSLSAEEAAMHLTDPPPGR